MRVGDECVLTMDGAIVDAPPAPPEDGNVVPDAPAATDAPYLGDVEVSRPACGDGTCTPASPGDDLALVESCATCNDDCSASCGMHECSWVFYCAREMRCTEVTCVAGCMPEGDRAAQEQYLGLYACMEDRCASVCFDGVLGGGCIACVCSECPSETAACGGLSCT
jgi:hypothetical protein